MVIRTPWQFGDRSGNGNIEGEDGSKLFPQLRVEHPASRLGDPQNMNLRGMSRQSSRLSSINGITNFPNIPEGVDVHVGDDRNKVRLPIFGNTTELTERIESRLTNRSQTSPMDGRASNSSFRMSVFELEKLIRDKMKNGYFSMKNLFSSYDPSEKGTVERECFHRILSTFLSTPLSFSQFNRIMKRFGFSGAKFLSFDQFYNKVKLTKKDENEYPSWFNRDEEKARTQTANQIHSQLKTEATRNLDELLIRLKLNESENVVKLVFSDKLTSSGYNLSEKEFEKLWQKYDNTSRGIIHVKLFVDKLTGNDGNHSRNTSRISHHSTSVVSPPSERDQSISVEKWLSKKFREGFHDFLHAFKEFEVDGTVTREQFLMVLRDYGLVLDNDKLDAFLQRCGIQAKNRIKYKDFLGVFQHHNNEGLTDRVLKDPKHRYHNIKNVPSDNCSIVTSVSSIEAHLLHMLQKDYYALLDAFKKIDKRGTNSVSEIEFRAVFQSFFNINLSDSQFKQFIRTVPMNENGRIVYQQFLSKFTRDSKTIYDTCSSVDEGDFQEMADQPRASTLSFYDNHDHVERTGDQLCMLIKHLLREKYQDVEKTFYEIDELNTKRMSKDILRKLLYRVGLKISATESNAIWDTLLTDRRGTLEFQQFIRHFGYSLKSAAFPNAKKHPPIRGDSDFRILSNRLNSWKDLIQDFAKSSMENSYSVLMKRFEKLDNEKTGFVKIDNFKAVLQSVCAEITLIEVNIIAEKFSSQERIFWPEFMKQLRPARIVSRTGHNMKDIMKHQQIEGLSTITENAVDGMPYQVDGMPQRFDLC